MYIYIYMSYLHSDYILIIDFMILHHILYQDLQELKINKYVF